MQNNYVSQNSGKYPDQINFTAPEIEEPRQIKFAKCPPPYERGSQITSLLEKHEEKKSSLTSRNSRSRLLTRYLARIVDIAAIQRRGVNIL